MAKMSLVNTIFENIILPSSDVVLGQSISKDLKFLMGSQWWTKDQINDYQNIRLRQLIKHAYDNVPYYKEVFDNLLLKPSDICNIEDLSKLPILTKDIIRKNINNGKIIALNISKRKMISGSSSGSTGEPLQFFSSKKSLSFNYACGIRSWYWMGYRLGDKYVKLSQNPRNNIIKIMQDYVNRSLYLYSQQLNNKNFKIIVEKINEFKPLIIRGYPDPLLFLADYIKNNNIEIYAPKAITTTGNILYPKTRNLIEEIFRCKVFDSYSCEGGANVAECETHSCYHTSMEYAITEILSNNSEVGNGEKGRLITTDLHNFAVPIIRYDSQDYVTKSKKECICGRKLLAIEKIDGRDSDILITPKGKLLIDHNFSVYFKSIGCVEQFQIWQNALNDFKIILKVNSKYSKEVEKNIYNYWDRYIDENVNIDISVVDDIPLTKSGKRRYLIRNQNIKLPF